MIVIRNIFPNRNRPLRCKSRWRKTKILKAERWNAFITIQHFPKTEEERQEIERQDMVMLLAMGTVVGPAMFKDPEKMLEMAKEDAHA